MSKKKDTKIIPGQQNPNGDKHEGGKEFDPKHKDFQPGSKEGGLGSGAAEAKHSGVGKLGQSDINFLGFRQNSPIIENLGEDVKVYGAMSSITGSNKFDVKDSANSYLAMKDPKRKTQPIVLPNLPSWTEVYDYDNYIGESVKRARTHVSGNKVSIEALNLGFTLNFSGENVQRNKYISLTFPERNKITVNEKADDHLVYLKVTNNHSQSKARGTQSSPASVESSLLYDSGLDTVAETVLDDIGSFNKRLSYQLVNRNLTEAFASDPSRRFYHLVGHKDVMKGLTNDAITIATALYIILDSFKGVLQNRVTVLKKHGVIDGVNRRVFALRSHERKILDYNTDIINRFLSLVPVNSHVLEKWETYSGLEKYRDSDLLKEDNFIINKVFNISLSKHTFSTARTETEVILKDNLAQRSLRFVDYNIAKTVFEVLKTRSVKTSTSSASLLSLSRGIATQYMEDIFDILLTKDLADVLEKYIWDTIELWSLFKDVNAFSSTIFKYKQVSNDWYSPSLEVDVKQSAVSNYIFKADNYNNHLVVYSAQELLDFTSLKQTMHTRYFDTEFHKERFVKAIITDGSATVKRVTGGFSESTKNLYSVLLFDTTCFPLILVDHLHASGTYPITFRAFKYSFTHLKNQVFYWLPISYASTDLRASDWAVGSEFVQDYSNGSLFVDDAWLTRDNPQLDFKGYHEALVSDENLEGRGKLISYSVRNDRIYAPFAPKAYSSYTEVSAEFLSDKDIL